MSSIFFTATRPDDNPNGEPVVVCRIYTTDPDTHETVIASHVMTIEGANVRRTDLDAAIDECRAMRAADQTAARLDAEWHRAFDALRVAGLEANADHPIAAAYRAASDAVNHANRSRDFRATKDTMYKREAIQAVIDANKPDMYTNPAAISDAEALGVIVSVWSSWDGDAICEAFLAALEDANFHTLRAKLEPIIREDLA